MKYRINGTFEIDIDALSKDHAEVELSALETKTGLDLMVGSVEELEPSGEPEELGDGRGDR